MKSHETQSVAPPGRYPLPRGAQQVCRAWLLGWLAGPVLGIANGVVRDLVCKDRVGEMRAGALSTVTLVLLLAAYMALLERRWPIPTLRTACAIGANWMALTVLFEFVFGHYVAGDSWDELLDQYDITTGHAWIFVPLWMLVGPATLRALRGQRLGH